MSQMMMLISSAAVLAWALVSVPLGILVGAMLRTSRDREFDRRPLHPAFRAMDYRRRSVSAR